MRKYFLIFVIFINACSPVTQEPAELNSETILNTPEVYYTDTPIPEPTIDYQSQIDSVNATSQSVIQTSDVLNRLQTEATAAYEQIAQENVRFTHEADLLTAQSVAWTATMMPTSVSLTATQQAVLNTQIPMQQALLAGQITSTHEAPELLLKAVDANNAERYGFIEYFLKFIFMISVSFFLVLLGLWLYSKPEQRVQIIEIEKEPSIIVPIDDYAKTIARPETVIAVEQKSDNYPSQIKYAFPCTDDQLTELAQKVVVDGLSLAYDNFMGNDSLFTRETYAPVYSFLQSNRLAISTGIKNKGIILTDDSFGPVNGRAILTGWLDTHTLPDNFSTAPLPTPSDLPTGISYSTTEHVSAQHVSVAEPGTGVQPAPRLVDLNTHSI
jgi:hypothetical protein